MKHTELIILYYIIHFYFIIFIDLFHFYNINHIIKIKQSNKDFIEILLYCEISEFKKSVSIINNTVSIIIIIIIISHTNVHTQNNNYYLNDKKAK